MTDKPLTEKPGCMYSLDEIQSAKRLLKQKLCYKNDFLNVVCKPGYQCKRCEIVDACFQIDDNDKEAAKGGDIVGIKATSKTFGKSATKQVPPRKSLETLDEDDYEASQTYLEELYRDSEE
jgi:hypothetical protein